MNTTLLYEKARALAGRDVVVEETTDGKFIVLWMAFEESPPPKGDSEDEALIKFIEMMGKRVTPNLEEDTTEDTNGNKDTPVA